MTNGREYADAAEFIASVDNSAWDFATACSSCHVGGGLTAHDREGTRYSQRPTFQGQAAPLNAYDYTVWEYWMGADDMTANPGNPAYANGAPAHYVNDQGRNYHLNSDGSLVDTDSNPATEKLPGFAPGLAPWAYPYDMTSMGVSNFMMPNVREIDCMFCHMEGYNNIISSVAVQMGALNAAPAMGAGLLNMFTQAYIPGVVETMNVNNPLFGSMDIAYLPGSTVSRIKGNPPSENCRLCHSPTTMENFSDMFDKFLAASPMEYNPASPFAGPTGLAMPGYDLNAAFVNPSAAASPVVYGQQDGSWVYADGSDAGGPFAGLFPMALFQTYKNVVPLNPMAGEMGGSNLPGSGPIYFNGGADFDQAALKKATIPFPRADFFKRGDLFDDSAQLEAHHQLDCASCHMDTDMGNKDQCDPGRGYARLGGVESGTNGVDKTGQDSRNTVKRCEHCHITGKNDAGDPIATYGAGNPTAAHAAAGLTAKITNAVGAEGPFTGDHLDIIDCTVCHMKKQSMAVRALDCLSGNRYPTMIGFQSMKGMMAMFTDPMGLKDVPEDQVLAMTGYPKNMLVNEMVDWSTQPQYDLLKGWWHNGPETLADGSPNPNYRRKVYNINMITAILWDNNGAFDANGDGATGVEADAQAPVHGGHAALGFDPWIQRDLKAGMTFADTGFAVVPIGFGDPTDPTNVYGAVYAEPGSPADLNSNGFNDSTGWDYVGVYGGNIIFTTPEQINAYQAFRTGMDAMAGGNKPWDNTDLTVYGGPFQVTHNVVAPSVAVLGTSCNDCHDADSHFFSGGYDMTGTGVPTADTVDMDGDGTAETDLSAYNMMQRPLVDYEITADADDLVTAAESWGKETGHAFEVDFVEQGCWDPSTKTFTPESDPACTGGTFARTTDLSRAAFLYPELDHAAAEAKAAAMELNRDLPSIPTVAAPAITAPATVEHGSQASLAVSNPASGATYMWLIDDVPGKFYGPTLNYTFDRPGVWKVVAVGIGADGSIERTAVEVEVAAETEAPDFGVSDQGSGAYVITVTDLPTTFDTIRWFVNGLERPILEGLDDTNTTITLGTVNGASGGTREFTVFVYDGNVKNEVKRGTVTLP